MKILKKKGFCNKLIIVLLAIIIVNMLIPMHEVKASDYEIGGVLLHPIISLVLKLGDGVVDMVHKVIYGTSTSLLEYDTSSSFWELIAIVTLAVITLIIIVFAAYAAPAAAGALGSMAKLLGFSGAASLLTSGAGAAIGMIVKFALGSAIIAGMYIHYTWFGDIVVLPLYQISPQEIFAGQVEFLNSNFFTNDVLEDEENEEETVPEITEDTEITQKEYVDGASVYTMQYNESDEFTDEILTKMRKFGFTGNLDEIDYKQLGLMNGHKILGKWYYDGYAYEADLTVSEGYGTEQEYAPGLQNTFTATMTIYKGITLEQGEAKPAEPIINSLKPTVARWYYALRTFAIILMMTELVYIGIRMMLCSVASEKAKYKNMLKDWVIATCLLFLMHYIMAFANIMVDSFTNVINTLTGGQEYTLYINDEDRKIEEAIQKDAEKYGEDKIPQLQRAEDDDSVLVWKASNIMGLARVQAQMQGNDVQGVSYIGYTIAFLVLVFYTVYFLFIYIKRLVYLSFLTIISPLVALTYPIDKINDGKAQAFDMWFKEYIFNLLIQPFHLILYTVLITSAFELAVENILYTLVAIGFLMPAEKLLRKFFGFEKAQTPGMLGGAAGAALVMGGMNKLLHKRPHKELGDGDNGGKIKEKNNLEDFKAKDDIDDSVLFGGMNTLGPSGSETDGKLKQVKLGPGGIEFGEGKSNPVDSSLTNALETNSKAVDSENLFSSADKKTNSSPASKTQEDSKFMQWWKGKSPYKAWVATAPARRGLSAYTGAYTKQKLKGFAKGTKKFVRKMPKMAAGAALGIGAGMIGATAGIASGDFGNTFKYAGAGMAGGYALGSSLINPNDKEKERLKGEYERAYYGNEVEYKKAKLEEQRNKYMKDEDNIRAIQNYLNCDEKTAKQVLEKNSDCLDKGIIDPRDIATIEKAISEGWEKNTAVKAVQTLSKSGKAPSKMNKDEEENWNHQARKIVEKAGYSGANADAAVKNLNKRLDDIYKIKDNLTKI